MTNFGDSETIICITELHLLRQIAYASRDLLKGKDWPEFTQACGGQPALEKAHIDATIQWKEWLDSGME